jgi:hypothetical protein
MQPTETEIRYAAHWLSREAGIVSLQLLKHEPGQTPLWEVCTNHGSRSTYCSELDHLVQVLSL